MANKYMKRCLTPLIIREIQTKTTMGYHLIPVGKTVIIKTSEIRIGEYVEKKKARVFWWNCKLVQPLW